MRSLLVLLIVISSHVSADCNLPVQPIKQGQAAQCSGYLFSPGAESDAYKAKTLYDLQVQEDAILTKRLENYAKQNEALSRSNNNENFYRMLYFGLGAVLTGYIAKNVR